MYFELITVAFDCVPSFASTPRQNQLSSILDCRFRLIFWFSLSQPIDGLLCFRRRHHRNRVGAETVSFYSLASARSLRSVIAVLCLFFFFFFFFFLRGLRL